MVKTFLPYPGGQSPIIKDIMENMPPDKKYNKVIEGCFGGGAFTFAMLTLKLNKEYAGIEIDSSLTNYYRVVKDVEGCKTINRLMHRQLPTFEELQKRYNASYDDPIESARDTILLKVASYNSSAKSIKPGHTVEDFRRIALAHIKEGHKKLRYVTIHNGHFRAFLHLDGEDVLWFFDPPYHRVGRKHYRYCFTVKDYVTLRDFARTSKGYVMITLNDTHFVRRLYKGFRIEEIDSKATGNHILILNYNADGTRISVPEYDDDYVRLLCECEEEDTLHIEFLRERLLKMYSTLLNEGCSPLDAGNIIREDFRAFGAGRLAYIRDILPSEAKHSEKARDQFARISSQKASSIQGMESKGTEPPTLKLSCGDLVLWELKLS